MAGPQYVYVMKGLSKTYPGGRQVLRDIWLSFYPGAKIGVIGLNGAGKSTLLRIMAGVEKEFTGEAWAADKMRVGYLPQEPELDPKRDVVGNVMEAVSEKKALVDRFNEIAANYSDETADEMAELQDKIDAQDLWDLDSQVEMAMDALRCPDGASTVDILSGGEKRRVALCKLLLEAPDILLLDEPTNHLDAESVAWLERTLREYKGTVILVTHDRYFLDNVTGWILELDRGHGIPHEGNYSTWLDAQEKRLVTESGQEEARVRSLAREAEWVKSSPRARQAKSKARIASYEELLAKSQEARQGAVQITIPAGPRLGSLVVEAKDIGKGYDDRLLFENLNFTLPPGGIVGVVGPNGAGKTTLFRMLTEQETPDFGTLRVGETVVMGYVDQSRDSLKPEATVWEEISDK
ncbi:MAG: energy-dependent translational throttle protein EttA, partial [Micropepsaceae bacterium]